MKWRLLFLADVRLTWIRVVCCALASVIVASTSALGAEDSYIVKRGDTLYGIARSHGIPLPVLAERNGLGKSDYIYIGQRLVIPPRRASTSGKAAGSSASALPQSIQRAIDKAPVRKGRWRYIVLHHSDVDTGTMKSMDRYHRDVRHMENGLAYHFVIGNGHGMSDGEIGISRRWTKQLDGGHLASQAQNKVAIGICLVGNFDKHAPTRKQLASLKALVEALMARCNLTPKAVKTHQQINIVYTRCPGAKFPTKSFISSLKAPGH